MADIRLTVLSDSLAATYGTLEYAGDPGAPIFSGRDGGPHRLLCPRCEYVIGANVEGPPPFMNGAVRCPGCRVVLHATKPMRYARNPVLQRDAVAAARREVHFKVGNPSWMGSAPDWIERLTVLGDRLLGDLNILQNPVPPILYHYTSRAGMLGIVGSGTIWASDLSYMNDASEKRYAIELVEALSASAFRNSGPVELELLRRAIPTLRDTASAAGGEYIACFCTDGDLLSQWRSYGSGGGCALGFYSAGFSNFELRKMIYEREAQERLTRQVIGGVLEDIREVAGGRTVQELDTARILPMYAGLLRELLGYLLPAFKHIAFREEQEWRLLVQVIRDRDLNAMKFRQTGELVVPYVTIRPNQNEQAAPPLPLVSVTCGPSNAPDLLTNSCHLLLEQAGYDHVEVSTSGAPLRV